MQECKKIKIGIDFHGVITAHPQFFKKFNQYAIAGGCQIYILSGGHCDDVKKQLDQQGILYTHIWSMLDYYDEKCKVTYLDDGSFKVDDKLWNTAKADYCHRHQIDFHIDDSNLYGEYFKTPYCQYDMNAQKCVADDTSQVVIDFNQDPEVVLKRIVEIICSLKKKASN